MVKTAPVSGRQTQEVSMTRLTVTKAHAASIGAELTHGNDSHNFLHFANLALLPYVKLFQDRLNLYLTGHLLNRFGEYRFDVSRQPPPIDYRLPILGL